MILGLRIDVDTFRGTKIGVPALCGLLSKHQIEASFYFSLGPDNMGRNLWRLLRPTFLKKMLRSKAANLYGWDILLRGTFWPGKEIASNLSHVIKLASDDGHEIGYHAWDHYTWQTHIDKMSAQEIHRHIQKGVDVVTDITGFSPSTSASPAWRATSDAFIEKSKFPFSFNSDCRGDRIFYPVVNGQSLKQLQIPTTLPTYDEIVGQNGITNENFNDHIVSLLKPKELNVLTIHAEAEGIACLEIFDSFLSTLKQIGVKVLPLGKLVDSQSSYETRTIEYATVPGRDGWITMQGQLVSPSAQAIAE